ncbi:MAG TPA: hypothetical protein VLA34_01885, partial [Candidatus Krumholzibacterium sp.]|nr:hypothetical protein [Candidatus Krumholzibacterium sp.]
MGFASVEGTAAGSADVVFAPTVALQYAGYIEPVIVVPGMSAAFKCLVANTSTTGVYLSASSDIYFTDGIGNDFAANLAAATYIGGGQTDTLYFNDVLLPAGFLGGSYTPELDLAGTDIYGSPYRVSFDAGSNSVEVSSIEITGITALNTIVSRGDTARVDVAVRNNGGAPAVMRDIVLDFSNGNYSLVGAFLPPLPDTIQPGLERTYSVNVRVLPDCPQGVDTIDASAYATVGTVDVYDYSAGSGRETWLVQSAALISYSAGTLDPATVSTGQVHAFSLRMQNMGEAAVILDEALTYISFDDGSETYSAYLTEQAALPGQAFSTLEFESAAVPPAFIPGSYPVSVGMSGTENGAAFD